MPLGTIDVDIEPLDPESITRGNVNDGNEDGVTPLMRVALTTNDIKHVKSLLRKRANLDQQDKGGNTVLMWVVKSLFRLKNETRCEMKLSILDLLLNRGADVNLADNEGYTPMMIAAMGNDEKSFAKLVNKKAMVELTNQNGETALHLAIKYNASTTIINSLNSFYQKMNVRDNNGHSPFMIASFRRKLDLMRTYHDKGVDINEFDVKGWTALMYAVNCGDADVVNLLKELGADFNLADSHGKTALEIARILQNSTMALLLRKLGAFTNNIETNAWMDKLQKELNLYDFDDKAATFDAHTSESTGIDFELLESEQPVGHNPEVEAETSSSISSQRSTYLLHWASIKLHDMLETFRRIVSPIFSL
ncbi:ankyrin repeat domain-containing protein [Acerihabitans sp. KWT182]|uniref:Ankyrin repeat domain-containing protein n=1 Tax=Acerihabitans sp. KWT182 TaxID=3157919 RepID=A0AAU7QC63_9GAMM